MAAGVRSGSPLIKNPVVPKKSTVVRLAVAVLDDGFVHKFAIHESAITVTVDLDPAVLEPTTDRHAESLLCPVENVVRKHWLKGML